MVADLPAVGPRRVLLVVVPILALALAFAPAAALTGTSSTGAAAASRARSEALLLPTVRRMPDGTRIACAQPADCRTLEAALVAATDALDPVLPRTHRFSAVTMVAPTPAGQLAVVGARGAGAPAATTLLVGDDLVRRRVAPPWDRGRVWIVVNPAVTRAGADLSAEVLTHELVHVRTRAADLPGPLWVEEGYAVALTHRALGAQAGPTLESWPGGGAEPAPPWPADDWSPTSSADYAVAGAVVESLAGDIGWDGVARWYAATASGTSSQAAAQQVQDARRKRLRVRS